jgi:hypothetical protein
MTGIKLQSGGINMSEIQKTGFRRDILQGTAITGLVVLTFAQILAATPSKTDEQSAAQPAPPSAMS